MSKHKLVWKKKPEAEDYEGALSFLLLIYPELTARGLLRSFRKAKTVEHAAKDLLRAAGLPLLAREDTHVEEDLARIHKGKDLPPVLLVRGDMTQAVPLSWPTATIASVPFGTTMKAPPFPAGW
jgi:hypothetical protein